MTYACLGCYFVRDNKDDMVKHAVNMGHEFSCVELEREKERQHQQEPKQDFGHTTSSVKPRFGLIPHDALVSLANRFELGENKHAGKAWNALSNQIGLENEAWVISRVEHVIHHAYTYLQKLKGLIPDDGDDDAAAIMWGGSLLHEAKRQKESKIQPKS